MADPVQITQEITALPAAPVEGSGFRVRAAAFLAALVTFAGQLIAWRVQVNAVATAVNADAETASTAAAQAEGARDDAAASRAVAATSATQAAQSATAAGQSATAAGTKATEAAASATAAGQSATAAGQSAGAAQQAAVQAATARDDAGELRAVSASAAAAASTKATEAANSATLADGSKTAAAASATAAASSATTASTKATEAANSATAADGSKTAAANSATAAAGSATTAAAARDQAVAAANTATAGGISKSIGTAAGDLIYFTASGVPTRLPKGNDGQILMLASGLPAWQAAPQSGASKWTALTAATDYATTPASTSTITMATDQTATIKPGMAVRYTIGGTAYYGVVTAITSGLLTVAGAPLSGTITALAYSIFPGMVEVAQVFVPGYWADAADTSLIANDLVSPLVWGGPPAALVRIQAMTRTTDTGASYPRINARIGATTTDRVCTSNAAAGLALAASATWYSTVVDIDPAKYAVSLGGVVELTTDANGGNDNAADVTVVLTFVYA